MVSTLKSPPLVGGRELAREFASDLPADLTADDVIIDCANLEASAPSFVDELVKIVLVERNARRLSFEDAPERTASYALRSAENRDVADRLEVTIRTTAAAG